MRRENDARIFTEYVYIILNSDETAILDGGFEARKGRVWKGLETVLARYRRFLLRNYQLIMDIERHARLGTVEQPDVHIDYVRERIKYYEGLILYQLDPEQIDSGLIMANGTIKFVRVGELRDIAKKYGYYVTEEEYRKIKSRKTSTKQSTSAIVDKSH